MCIRIGAHGWCGGWICILLPSKRVTPGLTEFEAIRPWKCAERSGARAGSIGCCSEFQREGRLNCSSTIGQPSAGGSNSTNAREGDSRR